VNCKLAKPAWSGGTPLASSRLFCHLQVPEAPEDQEAIIEMIDAMLAKQCMASALTPVGAPA